MVRLEQQIRLYIREGEDVVRLEQPYTSTSERGGGRGQIRTAPTPGKVEDVVRLEQPLHQRGGGCGQIRTAPTPGRVEDVVRLEQPLHQSGGGRGQIRTAPTPERGRMWSD